MWNLKRRRSFTNPGWLAWANLLPPKSTEQLLWSGSFLKQVHRWVQSGAEFSWRGTRIQSSIGRIQTPLSSSRWPINAGGQVTGGGANSTLTARRTRTRARPQRLIKCHAARAGGRGH